MKRNMKRKGFTLVELLIVILVIGILSAMMMLSSTEAVTSAQASNIISNLRNLKTAALALYVDKLDAATSITSSKYTDRGEDTTFKTLIKYLNTGSVSDSSTNSPYKDYGLAVNSAANDNTTGWFVYCSVSDTRVQEKLAGRASSVGLCGALDAASLKANTTYTKGNGIVGMWVVNPGEPTTTTTGS